MTHDMSCVACRDLLPWYVAGTLTASERAHIDQHLASCAACRAELQLWRHVGLSLQRADQAVPPEMGTAPAWQTLSAQLFPPSPTEEKIMPETPMAPVAPTPRSERKTTMQRPQPDVAPRARRVALLLPVAALLFVLIGAVALAALRPNKSTVTVGTALPAVPLPPGGHITNVDLVSPQDIWAVGYMLVDDGHSITPNALIIHYTNGHWATVSNGDFPESMLSAVAMSGPDDGWAVGSTGNMTSSSNDFQPLVLHYAQGHWAKVPTPTSLTTAINGKVDSVNIIAADSVWFGGANNLSEASTSHPFLWHYSQGAWSSITVPVQAKSFDMVADNEGWAMNNDTIWHYQDGQWNPQYTNTAITLTTLTMASSQGGWASGYFEASSSSGKRLSGVGNVRSLLLHYDGSAWSLVDLPPTLLAVNSEEVTPFFMPTAQDGWGVISLQSTNDATRHYVLRYHAGHWTREYIGTGRLFAVAGMLLTASGEGWAVTVQGGVAPPVQSQLVLMHERNGIWSTYINP